MIISSERIKLGHNMPNVKLPSAVRVDCDYQTFSLSYTSRLRSSRAQEKT